MALLRIYINKLKNSFVYKTLLNNYFLIAFLILLVLVSINNLFCIVLLIIYIIYLYKKAKIIFKIGLVITAIIVIHFFYLKYSYSYEEISQISGEVIEIKFNQDSSKITIKNNNKKYVIYDYNKQEITYGDIIDVKAKPLKADSNRIEYGFNYQEYLRNNRIFSTMLAENIKIIDKKFNYRIIKYYFNSYLETMFSNESYSFIKAVVVGDLEDVDENFMDAIIDNGILHLFAVSGLHIVLFIGLIEKLLKFFKLSQNKIDLINSIFLILYLIITCFSPSVLRASLMFYISLINKKRKLGLSTLDIISVIFIILLISNPLYYYNLGFSLSFVSSTIIVLVGNLFNKYNKYLQVFFISIFANLLTFPLVININGKMNILSPISNVIFIELVEIIVLPLSFFIIVLPIFRFLYDALIIGFNKIIILFSDYFVLNVKFPLFKNYNIVLYYLLLYLLLRVYKRKSYRLVVYVLLIVYLMCFSYSTYIIPKTEVHFLDLANGEATLIIDSKNECYALIDTGDGKNNEVTSYLKKQGIKKLTYLIITHNHLDHNGELNNILREIKVHKLVISSYNNSVTNKSFVIKVEAFDELICGSNKFLILHPDKNYLDENDNSIVIHSKIGGLNFLFLGDATKSVEEQIANNNLNVDVIKIAHHGSQTSSSAYLIDKYRPRYAIIMTGRVAKFGFPHKATIELLESYNIKIYRTDLNYSIIYKYSKNQSIFDSIK